MLPMPLKIGKWKQIVRIDSVVVEGDAYRHDSDRILGNGEAKCFLRLDVSPSSPLAIFPNVANPKFAQISDGKHDGNSLGQVTDFLSGAFRSSKRCEYESDAIRPSSPDDIADPDNPECTRSKFSECMKCDGR